MKFLDLNGLKYLLKFMDRTVSVASSKFQFNSQSRRDIPFITNHQIINMDISGNINIFNWFQNASKGGILEIVFAGAQEGNTYCTNKDNVSFIYQMVVSPHDGPMLNKINVLNTTYNTYARLIKTDDDKLVVVEFVQNQ